jgi:transcriptional regulator with XRE-family HTH domain
MLFHFGNSRYNEYQESTIIMNDDIDINDVYSFVLAYLRPSTFIPGEEHGNTKKVPFELRDMAHELGFSSSKVCKIENNGTKINVSILHEYAVVLKRRFGVEFHHILGMVENLTKLKELEGTDYRDMQSYRIDKYDDRKDSYISLDYRRTINKKKKDYSSFKKWAKKK